MMRWTRHRPPPPGLGQGVGSRLLFLATLLFLLYVSMVRLHRNPGLPGSFLKHFVTRESADQTQADRPNETGLLPRDDDAAFSVPVDESPPAGKKPEAANAPHAAPDVPPASNAATPNPNRTQINPLALRRIEQCATVNPGLLDTVRDKSPNRLEETPAIHHLMCVAATTPAVELAAMSLRDVRFKHLFNSPNRYRGSAVRVVGTLARLDANPQDPDQNEHGISRYYEAWIFPEDQYLNPMVVLVTSLPPGLHPNESMRETVAVDAFFLKLHAFRNRQGVWHAAPLLVGSTLQWRAFDRSVGTFDAVVLALAFVVVVACGAAIFWWYGRRDERLADQYRELAGRETAPSSPIDPRTTFFEFGSEAVTTNKEGDQLVEPEFPPDRNDAATAARESNPFSRDSP